MIQVVNICALVVGILGVACFNLRARSIFSREDARIQKYRLFKIRDNLIHLVAEEKLREDSFVFAYFYRAVDFFIRHTDQLTLRSVVEALRQAQNSGLDPSAAQELKRVENKLLQESAEVRSVVSEYYDTIVQVLIENSFVIRFTVKHADVWRAVNELGKVLGSFFSTERLAYAFYKAYKNAARTTAHAT